MLLGEGHLYTQLPTKASEACLVLEQLLTNYDLVLNSRKKPKSAADKSGARTRRSRGGGDEAQGEVGGDTGDGDGGTDDAAGDARVDNANDGTNPGNNAAGDDTPNTQTEPGSQAGAPAPAGAPAADKAEEAIEDDGSECETQQRPLSLQG